MNKKSYFEIQKQPVGTSFVIRFVKNPIDVSKSVLYFKYPYNKYLTIKSLSLAYVNSKLCCLLLPKSIYRNVTDHDKFYSSDSNIALVVQVNTKSGYRNYKVTEIQDDYFKIDHDIVSELKTKDIDLYRSAYDIYKSIKDVDIDVAYNSLFDGNLGVHTLKEFPFLNSYIREEKISYILN